MGIDIHLHDDYFYFSVPTVVLLPLGAIVLYAAWKFGRFVLAALGIWPH